MSEEVKKPVEKTDAERLEEIEEHIDIQLPNFNKRVQGKSYVVLIDGVQQKIRSKTHWGSKGAASQALGTFIRNDLGLRMKYLIARHYDYTQRKYIEDGVAWTRKDFENTIKRWKAKHATIIEDSEIQKADEILVAQQKAAELAEARRLKREETRGARAIKRAKKEAKKAKEDLEIRKKGRWYKLLEE